MSAPPPGAAAGAEFQEASSGATLLHFCSLWLSAPPTPWGGLRPPPQRGVAEGRPPVVSSVLALYNAHVPALNTAHVFRLNKADVLALNNSHVLRLNIKICPVLTVNEVNHTFGGFGRPPLWRRPKAASLVLAVNMGIS